MSLKNIPGMEREVTESYPTELPADLQESLELLIERDNPMADMAERALKRL